MKWVRAAWVAGGGHQSTTWRAAHRAGRRVRGDEEADTQARRQVLAEGADVDDPAVPIEALQRFERAGGVPELAVVVVFHDCGAGSGGPVQ
jgi:hypothetical protein